MQPNLSKVARRFIIRNATRQRKEQTILVGICDTNVFMHYQGLLQDYLQLAIRGSY